jgi:ketosteroid isomerase-like protein
MSSENVEVVKALVSASQRGDWETALAAYDPDVELDASRIPGGRVGVGRDALREFFRQWFGAWDRLTIEPERFIDAGDRVLVELRISGIGKGSRVEVSMRLVDVMTVRDGKVVKQVGYANADEGFEAAGFSDSL